MTCSKSAKILRYVQACLLCREILKSLVPFHGQVNKASEPASPFYQGSSHPRSSHREFPGFFDLFKVSKITTNFFDLFKVSKITKRQPFQKAAIQGAAISDRYYLHSTLMHFLYFFMVCNVRKIWVLSYSYQFMQYA